jgi:hypothetical protein
MWTDMFKSRPIPLGAMQFTLVSETYMVFGHADRPRVTTAEASKNPNDLPSTVTGELPKVGNEDGVILEITGAS